MSSTIMQNVPVNDGVKFSFPHTDTHLFAHQLYFLFGDRPRSVVQDMSN